jgi:hypothetical protein
MIFDEVSLCKQGADQDAYVVLYKSVDAPEAEQTETVEETNTEREATMADMSESLAKALEGIDGTETLSPEIVTALNAAFEAAAVVPEVTEPAAVGGGDVTVVDAPSEVAPVTEPVVEPVVEAAAATEVVDFSKSVEFVEMRKALTDAQAEAKAATAAAAAATEILAKKQEASDIAETVAKVKTEAPSLTADVSELGLALYRVAKSTSTQADADVIVAALSGASKLVAESQTFDERGTSTDITTDSDEMGRLVSKTLLENPGISKQQAIARAAATPEGMRLAGYN